LPVVLDAVCLREIASVERWGRGFNVYVKKWPAPSLDDTLLS
jgi:hypothetical protein